MKNIYDNGEVILGEVKNLKEYIKENKEEIKDFIDIDDVLKYLNELDDNSIVSLGYNFGMGYSIDYWTTKDIINNK